MYRYTDVVLGAAASASAPATTTPGSVAIKDMLASLKAAGSSRVHKAVDASTETSDSVVQPPPPVCVQGLSV